MSPQESSSEAIKAVDAEWQRLLTVEARLIDPSMVRAAYAHPRLRVLFPIISHGSLHLSRCTRIPYTRDVPALYRRAPSGFLVVRLSEPGKSDGYRVGETDTVEEAIDLIAANLPPGCGPAIKGTADDLT